MASSPLSQPITPLMQPALTPNLSSPGTPGTSLETPVAHLRTPAGRAPASAPVIRKASMDVDVGFDDEAGSKMRAALGVDVREASAEETPTPLPMPGPSLAEDDEGVEGLEDEEIQSLRTKLTRLGDGEAAGLLRRVVPTVEQVPFLREQIVTQQATIAAMQEQARVVREMNKLEQDRHAAERVKWAAEMRALARVREADFAAGTRPKKALDVDVGYHLELEARNKELLMKNQLMAPRLQDAQMQIERLVSELRHLRSHVILETHFFNADSGAGAGADAAPHTPRSAQRIKHARTEVSMGDARAEHLILAARKVRAMREKDGGVGHLTLGELQRAGIVGPGGGAGYAEGYGNDDDDELESEEGSTVDGSAKKKTQTTPLLPRARKFSNRKLPAPTTPSRSRALRQAPATTPGGNFTDLLRAAELATRPAEPGTPSRGGSRVAPPAATMSATRSTTFSRADSILRAGSESPSKRPRLALPGWKTREARESTPLPPPNSQGASALDILASASQLDQIQGLQGSGPSTTSANGGVGVLASAARFEGMMGDARASPTRSAGQGLAPAIDLLRRPSVTPPAPKREYDVDADDPFIERDATPRLVSVRDDEASAFQSPTGAAVPGLGRYVNVLNSEPAKRMRSPYSKWTVEEDELLARAVAQHGEKWDQVSKCVPTRSYHQVRQRWLRKTGAFDKKQAAAGGPDPSPLGKAIGDEHVSPSVGKRKA
ncbi:hypothetical protein Q5752_005325 [Cryptotrichosporon argae]